MENKKELLVSVTIKDCEVQAFRGTGAGGQKRNKTSSGIRVVHPPSGAIGKCQENREQHLNKKDAFLKMIETKEFKTWLKLETAKACGRPSIEELVEKQMSPENIKLEIKDSDGRYTEVKEIPIDSE